MANIYYIVEKGQRTADSKVVVLYGVSTTFTPVTVAGVSRLGALVPESTTDEQAIADFDQHATMETVHPSRVDESGYSPPAPTPEEDPEPPDVYWLTTFADEQALRDAIHTDPVGTPNRVFADYRLLCCTFMGRQIIEVTKPIKLGNTQLKAWGFYGPLGTGDFALVIRAVASAHWVAGDSVLELDDYSSIEGIEVDANGVADFAVKFAGTQGSRNCSFVGDTYWEACQVSSFYDMYVNEGTAYMYACNGASFHHFSCHDSPGTALHIQNAGSSGTFGPDGTECPQGAGGLSIHGCRVEACQGTGIFVKTASVVYINGGHSERTAEASGYPFHQQGGGTLIVTGMVVTLQLAGSDNEAPFAYVEGGVEQTGFIGCHAGGNIDSHYVRKAADVSAGWKLYTPLSYYNGTNELLAVDE